MTRLTITSSVISDLHVKRRGKFAIDFLSRKLQRICSACRERGNPFITPDIGRTGQPEIAGHRRSTFLLWRAKERGRNAIR